MSDKHRSVAVTSLRTFRPVGLTSVNVASRRDGRREQPFVTFVRNISTFSPLFSLASPGLLLGLPSSSDSSPLATHPRTPSPSIPLDLVARAHARDKYRSSILAGRFRELTTRPIPLPPPLSLASPRFLGFSCPTLCAMRDLVYGRRISRSLGLSI
jgi:hypothetical protein